MQRFFATCFAEQDNRVYYASNFSAEYNAMKITCLPDSLAHLLMCPQCGSEVASSQYSGLDATELVCLCCHAPFFWLDDIPCLFPSGVHQQILWQHQLGAMQVQAAEGLTQLQESASKYDLTEHSRTRLSHIYQALKNSQNNSIELLTKAGIAPAINEELAHLQLGDLAEYYDFILRDWAWGGPTNTAPQNVENQAALERIYGLLPKETPIPEAVLVLGAGAGRLSWDLHQQLAPGCTVAFDSNPLLLLVANELIRKQQPLSFAETKIFPQINRPITQFWDLTIPEDSANQRTSWFAVAGDAWHAPFKSHSFEIIITPWFIDVNGGDIRDMIGIISRLLKPGGIWLNSGPLLFTRHLPFQQKYETAEIQQFLHYCGFDFLAERVDDVAHLASPLEVRAQLEQVWSFCVKAPLAHNAQQSIANEPAPWLVMHHLAIPLITLIPLQQHPLIDAILALIDGINSINSIAQAIADYMPEGMSPVDAVVTILGQMLQSQKNT